MNKKQIIVAIAEDGSVRIDAVGFKGTACTRATAEIEKALGVPGKSSGKKPEFYQGQQQAQQH